MAKKMTKVMMMMTKVQKWGHLLETQSECSPIARPATHGPQLSSPNKISKCKKCVPFLIVCLSAPVNNSTPRTWSSNLQELCQKVFLANVSLFFLASANDILWEDGWMFESFPELESAE